METQPTEEVALGISPRLPLVELAAAWEACKYGDKTLRLRAEATAEALRDAQQQLTAISGLLNAKYLNPTCAKDGCQFLNRPADLKAELSRLTEERDSLQVNCSRFKELHDSLRADLVLARQALTTLRPYLRHHPLCAAWFSDDRGAEWREADRRICTCGLAALLPPDPEAGS